jgi:uncharacterized membrane protein YphA (DoxX/SURF4 family)
MIASSERPRRWDASGWPQLLARLTFGIIMITFAVPKIITPIDLLKEVHSYNILPEEPAILLNLVAVCLPWFELIGSLALILGLARRTVSLLFTGLLVVFTTLVLYRAVGLHQQLGGAFCNIKFDCGCGHGEVYICRKALENLGLIILALYCLVSRSDKLTVAALFRRQAASQNHVGLK